MSLAEQYSVGSVVWYKCDPKQFPWWPCEVIPASEVVEEGRIVLKSFQDHCVYSEGNPSKLKPFQCDEATDLFIKGKKKLRNRKNTLDMYCGAVQDAIELIQEKDENFSPGFDPYADLSTFSDMSQLSAATPGMGISMSLLNDSSLYSPNTCSKQNHRKAICATSEESFEMHSTPVKADFCSDMDTPPSDILCKVAQSKKNGGRKRAIKSTEKVESEPKKLKSSGNRSTSARRSGKKKKKTNGVSEFRHEANGDDRDEELVTKRLDFDTDLSVGSDILQPSLHPPSPVPRAELTHPPSIYSGKASRSTTSLSLVSDISVELYDGNSSAMLCATSDGEGLPPGTDQTIEQNSLADSSQEASSRSREGSVVRNKAQSNGKSKDSSDLAKSTLSKTKEVKSRTKRNGRRSPPYSTTSRDSGALFPPGSSHEGHVTKGDPTSAMKTTSGEEEEEDSHFQPEPESEASSRSESSESESSESASEDDLPAINMEVDESVSVSQLQPNDVIWVKHKSFPHWPALVTTVSTPSKRQKSKARASVVFFGYDQSGCPVSVRNKRNIARFGTKETEKFMERGRANQLRDAFQMAVNEARKLIQSRADGEIKGTPKEQLKEVTKWRPKNYKAGESPMAALERLKPSNGEDSSTPAPVVSAFGYDIGSTQKMICGNGSDISSGESGGEEEEPEEDGEDPPYTFEAVLKFFQELKPVLTRIAQGSLGSEYHRAFVSGTRSEKGKLKVVKKFGPIQHWRSDKKKNELVEYLAQVGREASDDIFRFSYAQDVLLPEAMIRTISKFEAITPKEAQKRL